MIASLLRRAANVSSRSVRMQPNLAGVSDALGQLNSKGPSGSSVDCAKLFARLHRSLSA